MWDGLALETDQRQSLQARPTTARSQLVCVPEARERTETKGLRL
jgi:hypothetical protein